MLDKLETVLSHLLEYHSALLDLGKEKITVITNKDIDRFEKITLEEQASVRKTEQEEKNAGIKTDLINLEKGYSRIIVKVASQ